MFEKYYESPAYGEWCRRVYGKDLKQIGCVTMDELEILYREIKLQPNSHILDMGCGVGYISAEIAEHYNSRLIGIDFDEDSNTHSKKAFSDNPAYTFIHGDGSEVSFDSSTFDLICFFDSLHFTGIDEKLYALLDKCLIMLKPGGKLAVFRGKDNRQLFIWGQKNDVALKTVDLTETNKKLWGNVFVELIAMASELNAEVPETYERLKEECIGQVKEVGWSPRELYVFKKSIETI